MAGKPSGGATATPQAPDNPKPDPSPAAVTPFIDLLDDCEIDDFDPTAYARVSARAEDKRAKARAALTDRIAGLAVGKLFRIDIEGDAARRAARSSLTRAVNRVLKDAPEPKPTYRVVETETSPGRFRVGVARVEGK